MDNLTTDSICGIKLYQKKGGYKFSLDPILLAGFTRITRRIRRMADLGAGSGIISLILAHRYSWLAATLVEIQENLIKLSGMNVKLNMMQDRISLVNADISSIHLGHYRDLSPGTFDAIVANPPFRKPGTGTVSPDKERALARHEIALTQKDFLKSTSYLLKNKGRFFIIYHTDRLSELIDSMRTFSLEPKRIRFVHPTISKRATMVLVDAVKGGGVELKVESPLSVYDEKRQYTEELLSHFRL
jgi:tRNA1Val (adenine37-N6)-methyltransferase